MIDFQLYLVFGGKQTNEIDLHSLPFRVALKLLVLKTFDVFIGIHCPYESSIFIKSLGVSEFKRTRMWCIKSKINW